MYADTGASCTEYRRSEMSGSIAAHNSRSIHTKRQVSGILTLGLQRRDSTYCGSTVLQCYRRNGRYSHPRSFDDNTSGQHANGNPHHGHQGKRNP